MKTAEDWKTYFESEDSKAKIRSTKHYHGWMADLARKYNVSHQAVKLVAESKTWRHV